MTFIKRCDRCKKKGKAYSEIIRVAVTWQNPINNYESHDFCMSCLGSFSKTLGDWISEEVNE